MAEIQRFMRINKPCILLIVISGMERFAFKGVASNLVTYLTDVMKMSNSSAAKTVNSWVGFTSMLPLLVATLADTYWDKYSTILASSVLYIAGLLALTSTALKWSWNPMNKIRSATSLSWSLYMISLGQGGYNPSLQAFGAEQLGGDNGLPCSTNNNDQSSSEKSLFFQWWYFGVCCGSLLGVSVMSYIQDTLGWGLGFAIPTIAMVTSIAMFLSGNRFYTREQEKNIDGKSFEEIIQAIKAAVSKMINRQNKPNDDYNVVELELQEKPLCSQDPDAIEGFGGNSDESIRPVRAAKMVLHLLPVWVMLLMFAVIFQQPATFFTKQGMTMRRNIGRNFKIPPAALQSAITVSIIILMPLYDTCFIPLVRIFTRNKKGINVMQRIGIGMFLSVIAMVVAALTERKRLQICKEMGFLETKSESVPFSIFWLLPQYILLGISDIFTVVGMQEFFYSEVPVRMRTTGIALYTSVFGVGSFLSALLISLIEYFTSSRGIENGWFSDNMNEARLDKYYWFLALSSAISLLSFVIYCRFLKSRT
ncbi:Protein NRT1/PTR FAMILY 5.8 [Abeliophyllum distichum]|uniref:Protein NRT1/PTR FAMILY 5.8 n=1 Tax=Abeliophyllum distichum TaxID=126358 RepID=A0ABD1SIG4_9LAMI